ncbi:MAG: DNA polymerase III subunit psi [Alteromonadaceae bacterium]|nr:DNA polymerase III subunit psi [Alteromonadaceae bacterium]
MTVSKRQFTQLKEMGIKVWTRRSSKSTPKSDENSLQSEKQQQYMPINFDALCSLPLFSDIISSIGLSPSEIKCQNNILDLGLMNWKFSETLNIELINNTLITPELSELAKSPSLKKQLWQTIQRQGHS